MNQPPVAWAFTRGGIPRAAIPKECGGFVAAFFGGLAQKLVAPPVDFARLLEHATFEVV
ncbi:hypothetical protein BH11MYX2_BH11MYX2_37430 [soil metagenome]